MLQGYHVNKQPPFVNANTKQLGGKKTNKHLKTQEYIEKKNNVILFNNNISSKMTKVSKKVAESHL